MSSNPSSPQRITPSSTGGYGRQSGTNGGLLGVQFAATCPPDIQKNTRIVAICGVPKAKSSPRQDGWFYSDFFLFFQMFRNQSGLPNQLWMSSCSPEELIRQHGQYLHGPPNGLPGHRRVVMNEEMLPENEMAAGFRTIPEDDLRDRFVEILNSEIKEASQNGQNVLVLIFGHGNSDHFGIVMSETRSGNPKDFFTTGNLLACLRKDVDTTVVLTSCYSGGWVMKPNANAYFSAKPSLNTTFLTAAGIENESISWSVSQTFGKQAGGSIFATCLLNSIMTVSEESSGSEKLVKVCDENGEYHGTIAALTKRIYEECESQSPAIWDDHGFSFAVKDDRWATAWGARTGLPVSTYRAKWERLPQAPSGQILYPEGSGYRTGSVMPRSWVALNNIVKVKAIQYLASGPGMDNAGGNTSCHPGFHRLAEGEVLDLSELDELNGVLDYRMSQAMVADSYAMILDIGASQGEINQFVDWEWKSAIVQATRNQSPERSRMAKEVRERFSTAHSWVLRSGLFDEPLSGQGNSWAKPKIYLAAKLAESSLSIDQIIQRLEVLLQYKLKEARSMAQSPFGKTVLADPEVRTFREKLYSTMSGFRQRLRSLSPGKKRSMSGSQG